MADVSITEDLRVFMRDHVETYEKLEILQRLRGRNCDRWWTCTGLATELKLPPASVEEALKGLCQSQLFQVREARGEREYRYHPATTAIGETAERLVEAYRTQRVDIIRLMSANAIERIRNSAIKTLADAFLVRTRKKDG